MSCKFLHTQQNNCFSTYIVIAFAKNVYFIYVTVNSFKRNWFDRCTLVKFNGLCKTFLLRLQHTKNDGIYVFKLSKLFLLSLHVRLTSVSAQPAGEWNILLDVFIQSALRLNSFLWRTWFVLLSAKPAT